MAKIKVISPLGLLIGFPIFLPLSLSPFLLFLPSLSSSPPCLHSISSPLPSSPFSLLLALFLSPLSLLKVSLPLYPHSQVHHAVQSIALKVGDTSHLKTQVLHIHTGQRLGKKPMFTPFDKSWGRQPEPLNGSGGRQKQRPCHRSEHGARRQTT